MSSCGGVGGSSNSGGNSVGGSNSVGGNDSANSVGGSTSSTSGNTSSVGSTESQSTTAEANNVDGANAKNGIDREAQTKADLNDKMDTAQTEQTAAQTEQANVEQAQTEQAQTEEAQVEQAKAEETKAEVAQDEQVEDDQAKTDKAKEQTLADKVVEKAKEMVAKAEEVAATVKAEVTQAYEKAKAQVEAFQAKQKELADLARKPEVRAMLDTIGFTEGTGLNYGKVVNGTVIGQNKKSMDYDETLTAGMKNVSTLDMSQHPNVSVRVNKDIISSAAGRYQFLSGTWNGVAQKLGLTNFHATSQDLAAVQLMKERNMIQPLLDGDLKTAVNRGANEWASLPKADGNGAYEGQNARSFEAIERAYNDFLNNARAMSQVNDFN